MEIENNIGNRITSTVCHTCGGPAPHWKCPKCKETSENFNPEHWKTCRYKTKMQAKCEACGEAESQCTCAPQQ